MKKIYLFSAITVLSAVSLSAQATETGHYYVKPYVGISYMNDVSGKAAATPIEVELEKGLVLGGAFGYRYNAKIAAEVVWEYRSNDSETMVGNEFYPDGNYASNTIYLNGLYYFEPWGNLTPYVGVGVGWIQEIDIDLERNGVETSYSNSGNFSYQGFAGVEYKLSAHWSVHTELRHSGAKSGTLEDEKTRAQFSSLNYKPFTWQLGVSYRF
ncbi:porin family protein [Vibrio cholerae]|nr:porin family protein [Vibrio cholerae]EJB8378479.1 porin family protein [Vibrio cholerae]